MVALSPVKLWVHTVVVKTLDNLHYTLTMSNTSNQGNKLRSACDTFYYITVKTIGCFLTSGTGVFQLYKKTLSVLESILDLSFVSHHL